MCYDVEKFQGEFEDLVQEVCNACDVHIEHDVEGCPNTGRVYAFPVLDSDTIRVEYKSGEGDDFIIYQGGEGVFYSVQYDCEFEVILKLTKCDHNGEDFIAYYDVEQI